MYKRWLSYIVPITIHQQASNVSRNLEVTWNNGELVLDSKNTNYSFGSLQRILRKGLLSIGKPAIAKMEHILVLGVAGGSVIRTLVDEMGYRNKITGVELDPEIITLANSYFGLDKIANLSIVIDDAFEFVLKTRDKYDLIIIDIFKDTEMPNFLFEPYFINRICFLLKNNGFYLFNTMLLNGLDDKRNQRYIANIDLQHYEVRTLPRVEDHNELIVVRKR